jgi:hypothetical protein
MFSFLKKKQDKRPSLIYHCIGLICLLFLVSWYKPVEQSANNNFQFVGILTEYGGLGDL